MKPLKLMSYAEGEWRELGRSADYREGVAAFSEKRKPNFTGK